MKKNKFLTTTLILVFLIILGGCSNISSYQKEIYDDDSKISKQGDSYSFALRSGSTNGNETEIKFITFNGMETLFNIDSKEEGTINLDYNSEINSGLFKLVLINPDDEIINIFEGSQNGSTTVNIKNGKSRLKIVGNDAKGEIKLLIKENGNIKIYNSEN